jgi:hypothetical protein
MAVQCGFQRDTHGCLWQGIRMKLSVHGLYEDAGFPLVLQTLAQ